MTILIVLIPIALLMGGAGIVAFFWAVKDNQFDDPEGAAARILLDDDLEDQDEAPPNTSR